MVAFVDTFQVPMIHFFTLKSLGGLVRLFCVDWRFVHMLGITMGRRRAAE